LLPSSACISLATACGKRHTNLGNARKALAAPQSARVNRLQTVVMRKRARPLSHVKRSSPAERDILLVVPIESREEVFRLEIRPEFIDNVDI